MWRSNCAGAAWKRNVMLHRIHLRYIALIIGFVLLSIVPVRTANPSSTMHNYNRLMDFIQRRNLEAPLVLLSDSKGEFDRQLNRENLAYLKKNTTLIEHIQQRLDAETLKWKLSGSSKRVLVVPEERSDYAELFEQYCKEAVDYALHRTQLPNPYLQIATLKEPISLTDAPAADGVTAYLVHNIADEYIEEYLFFNQDNADTKIKIKLSNRVFTGKIGSYTSKLTIGEDSTVEFVHEPYTLWQNSAKNPINVLVAPIEETLHIALRSATESAIRNKIARVKPQTLDEVQQVVDEWIAVEESIVGGLVTRLMPEIFARFLSGSFEKEMAESLAERDTHEQYRYLQQGIRIVADLGIRPAIRLYTAEPLHFKRLISQSHMAAASL